MNAPAETLEAAPLHRRGLLVGPFGFTWRPRTLLVTLAGLLLACALVVTAIAVGGAGVSVPGILRTLVGRGDAVDRLIVLDLRMPRVLTGALVGLALGVAGALMQTVTRNPLATPDVIGVSSGASFGAVAAILIGGGGESVGGALLGAGVPTVAALGAILAAVLVYGLGWRGGVQSYRLVLVGIGVGAILEAGTSYLLVQARITQVSAASEWLVGSLAGSSWDGVWPLLGVVAVLVPLALAGSAALAVSHLGDEIARGVGLPVQVHRLVVLALTVLLTAASVAAAGPVGFVAFVAPQIAVRAAGATRPPLLLSGLTGASLVLAADTAARTVFTWDVPVGIVTTAIGAPCLIWLLLRNRKEMTT
ncbi:iron ABC transporter permease [Streptomyces sp. CRN 30]|uniref:FecCD family ABC transporter permease n=1 Tax=Streptomyces sp. CRN 30 TaxID=3075613 RepID=UPI002A7EC956|nr:iron ABC transporter permease [Streptomyces sp. CRN 30]